MSNLQPTRSHLSLLLLPLLLLLPILTQAALFPPNSKVIQLTSSSFKREVLDIDKPTMVAFTAPWCGHCQKLVPEFEKAAKAVDGVTKFANLDCDDEKNKSICGKYEIKGFPTLKMFPPTKKRLPKDYRGERNGKSMADWSVEQLPLGAKKLKAEELLDWVEKNPDTPKVILFSSKHSSSPLYRSLALDFRSSMSFSFLKADSASVRSSARIHLGLDIKDDKDLPILIVIPSSSSSPFQKGNFKRFAGKNGYREMRGWLDEIKEEVGGVDRKDSEKPKTKVKPKVTKEKKEGKVEHKEGFKEHKINLDGKKKGNKEGIKLGKNSEKEGRNPEEGSGGAYEWKPQKTEEKLKKEQKEKEEKKKRFSEAAEKTKKQMEELKKKEKGVEGEAKKLVFGEPEEKKSSASSASSEPTSSQDSDSPLVSMAASMASAGQEIYASVVEVGQEALKNFTQEGSNVLGGIIENVSEAAEKIRGSINLTASDSDSDSDSNSEYEPSSSSDSDSSTSSGEGQREETLSWDTTKSKLLTSFKNFMVSENVDLDEEYSSDLAQAQRDATKLFQDDPKLAVQMAKDAEEWLMKNLQVDKETMSEVMGMLQRENLEDMLGMVKERFKEKDDRGVKGYGQILDEEEEEYQRIKESEDERERERLRKKSHDEL